MRQVGDTLVWLALIAMVAAVLYITPRVAHYVSSREEESSFDRPGIAWQIRAEPSTGLPREVR